MAQHIIVTTEPPVSPSVPTVTHYQQLASDFITAIDSIAKVVPQITAVETAMAKFTRGKLGISEQFLATAIAAVEQVPELQALKQLDPTAGRDTLQFLEAFRTVRDRAIAFANDLKLAFDTRKVILVNQSLQVYDTTKSLARSKTNPDADAHAANLKRDLGRKGSTKAQREEKKAARLADAVDREIAVRAASGLLTIHKEATRQAA